MAISNLASGLRTGVCTSTTRPTAPFNGQVIYETDSKQTLVWQGSAWVMLTDADTPPGLVLIKTQTLSGTSTQVDSCFTTQFDSFKVVLSGLTSSTVDYLTFRLVTGTTPNQTSNYYSTAVEVNQSGTQTASTRAAETFWLCSIVGSTTAAGGVIDVHNASSSTQATSFSAQGTDARTVGAFIRHGAGYFNGTTQFDGLWISTLNGTYTLSGTARVYGYRNAV